MALCCSRVCWCGWGEDPSPTYAAKSCSLVRLCLEMGKFHSSLLRLVLTAQEGASWPYQMGALLAPSWHSDSSWDYAKFHHSRVALGNHLQRGQLFWDQCFDEESTIPFLEHLCREAWWDVPACPSNLTLPSPVVLMKWGLLLSNPSDTLCSSWRSLPRTVLLGTAVILHISDGADSQEPVCTTQRILLSDPYWWLIVFDNVQHCRSFLHNSY